MRRKKNALVTVGHDGHFFKAIRAFERKHNCQVMDVVIPEAYREDAPVADDAPEE